MNELVQWRLNNVRVLLRCFLTIFWIHCTVVFWLTGTTYAEDTNQCSGFDTAGWTTPAGDIILEVGQTLEIFCSLNDLYVNTEGYSSENIVFYNGSDLVKSPLVTKVNKTTAKLSANTTGIFSSMFYCKLSHDRHNHSYMSNIIGKDNRDKSDEMVCLNSVQVGHKPQDVNNFTCISYNWEFLNVSWIPPDNGVKTNYSVSFQIPKRGGRGATYKCPNDEDWLHSRCMWSLTTNPSYRRTLDFLTFIVTGSNLFGNQSQMFKIFHYAHVLPNPPQEVKIINKTVSSVYLSWSAGALHIMEKGLIFKIEYAWSSKLTKLIYHSKDSKELVLKGDRFSVNVSDLQYPNMPYNFSIYARSAVAVGEEFWSSPSHLIVKTKPCPPYSSPKTDVGSFEIIHQTSSTRDVLVYWKALPETEHNGDNFYYNITVVEEEEVTSIKPDIITNSYAKFSNLNFNSYRFYIKSVNAEGSAKHSSSVYLPKKSDVIPEPFVFTKIDYGDGTYQLSWKSPDMETNTIVNFTTFWCESNKDRPYQCNGLLDWIHLGREASKHNFTINSNSSYQFAISANSATSSSGMVWASCSAQHDRPSKMKNVWIGKVDSYSIDVKWKLVCSERIDSIRGYYVYYCPTFDWDQHNCSEPEKSLKVYGDVATMHVNITNLKPFTNYRIQVAIFIKDDHIGPRSDEMVKRTIDGPPDVRNISVKASEITNTSAHLHWERPSVTNGVLKYYRVQYNNNETVLNTTEVTLYNLSSYTNYEIRVSACTLFCAQMEPLMLSTEIGVPSVVGKLKVENNSSHKWLVWDPPSSPAGPSPIYDVKVQLDELDKNTTVKLFEVVETKAIVDIPNCANEAPKSTYTLYVRAKNPITKDVNHPQYLFGEWSPAYSINCMEGGMPTLWKILLLTSLLVAVVSLAAFGTKKGFQKCQEMQDFDVTLPPKFINPQLFYNEGKQQDYQINIGSWPDDLAECDRLHSNSKITDIDQSSVDCIEIDMDTDRETDRSSSGC